MTTRSHVNPQTHSDPAQRALADTGASKSLFDKSSPLLRDCKPLVQHFVTANGIINTVREECTLHAETGGERLPPLKVMASEKSIGKNILSIGQLTAYNWSSYFASDLEGGSYLTSTSGTRHYLLDNGDGTFDLPLAAVNELMDSVKYAGTAEDLVSDAERVAAIQHV